jgi:nucleoside-diphosphate-sugar epimerase
MSLVGKKILVLGGNGYVGNYFAARLVQQAAAVQAMSRYSPR